MNKIRVKAYRVYRNVFIGMCVQECVIAMSYPIRPWHNRRMNSPVRRSFLVALCVLLALPVAFGAASAADNAVAEMTPDELETYPFDDVDEQVTVKPLSVGQKHTLDIKRKEVMALLARHLGIRSLKGNSRDLAVLQQVIDRDIIKNDQVRQWQSLGMVFGDLLVQEFGLHWVSYEDDFGVSKALRWRTTENYVFPVTVFSKRVRFKETLDVVQIFEELAVDINHFKQLPSPVAGPGFTR